MSKSPYVLLIYLIFVQPSCQATSFFEIIQGLTGFPDEKGEVLEKDSKGHNLHPVSQADSIEAIIMDGDQLSPSRNLATNGVLLHGLDKETARVFAMEARVGDEIQFGNLVVKVHHCEKAPADRRPESIAYISIGEKREGAEVEPIFAGWMFSSSPALSALDHPVYDVWVESCVDITTDDPSR